LNDILRARKQEMAQNYPSVRSTYQTAYELPELDPLRWEVSLCLVFGLYQAAITLTNHLLESMLKYALAYRYSLSHQPSSPPAPGTATQRLVDWLAKGNALYADKDLGSNINQACSQGLITKEQKKLLHDFREAFRNAYSHSDKKKTFGQATAPVTAVHVSSNKLVVDTPEEVSIADLLIGQGIFQVAHARQNALNYFLQIDAVVRHVLQQLFPDR
jgi:hypothetical protein